MRPYAKNAQGEEIYPRNHFQDEDYEMDGTGRFVYARVRKREKYARTFKGEEYTNGHRYAKDETGETYYPRALSGEELLPLGYRKDKKGNEIYAKDAEQNEKGNGIRYARMANQRPYYPKRANGREEYLILTEDHVYIRYDRNRKEEYALDENQREYCATWKNGRKIYAKYGKNSEYYPTIGGAEVVETGQYALDEYKNEAYPRVYFFLN